MRSLIFCAVILQVMLDFLASPSTASSSMHDISFDRVLIVVLENQPLDKSLNNPAMRSIIEKGTLLTNYYGLVNPSQPNYIGMIAGDLMGVHGDGNYDVEGRNLVDQMEEKGVSWKSYQEDYPGNCFTAQTSADGLYFRKHNPFMSMNNVRNNAARCAKIVNATELDQDLATGNVPQFSFYTPNMNNNGHDTGLAYAANYLNSTFLPKYLEPFNSTGNALMVITFDEGVKGNNKIYTLLVGDMIPEGHVDDTRYDHYSLLRLVQTNYGLGSLHRKDARATHITKRGFIKGAPEFGNGAANYTVLIAVGVFIAVIVSIVAVVEVVRRKRRSNRFYGESKRRPSLSDEPLVVDTV